MRRKTLQADIARALGISRQRVHVLARRGMPVDDVAKARAWRAEHLDADLVKPDPRVQATSTPAGDAALKSRKLAAVVTILEDKAKNAGGVTLPSVLVEKGLITGLQLLRASTGNATGEVFESMVQEVGEEAARKVFAMIDRWWGHVYNVACDAILLGFQRELPSWGVDFRNRWVTRARGNFPDQPRPGEPRALAEHDGA